MTVSNNNNKRAFKSSVKTYDSVSYKVSFLLRDAPMHHMGKCIFFSGFIDLHSYYFKTRWDSIY